MPVEDTPSASGVLLGKASGACARRQRLRKRKKRPAKKDVLLNFIGVDSFDGGKNRFAFSMSKNKDTSSKEKTIF
jgi:hypothetical protein